jgi:hypothetical protein
MSLSPEVITETLVSIVGVETTVLLVLIVKLGKFLHDQMKAKNEAKGDRDALNSKATP